MTVIVTRPEPDGTAFAALLAARGAAAALSPVMEIVFTPAAVDFSGIGALAFTSANGVRALAECGPAPGLPSFAVGAATTDAARAAGYLDIETAEGEIGSLARMIAAARAGGRFAGDVLHIAGSARAGDLVGALAASGVAAKRAVLYEARPCAGLSPAGRAALQAEPPADWAALFSPRSARLFVEQTRAAGLETRLHGVKAACLSEAVAVAARAAAWREVRVAADPSSAAMLDLIACTK